LEIKTKIHLDGFGDARGIVRFNDLKQQKY